MLQVEQYLYPSGPPIWIGRGSAVGADCGCGCGSSDCDCDCNSFLWLSFSLSLSSWLSLSPTFTLKLFSSSFVRTGAGATLRLTGMGAFTGDEMGGSIPGSVRAHIHNDTTVNIARTEVDITVMECVVHCMGLSKVVSIKVPPDDDDDDETGTRFALLVAAWV